MQQHACGIVRLHDVERALSFITKYTAHAGDTWLWHFLMMQMLICDCSGLVLASLWWQFVAQLVRQVYDSAHLHIGLEAVNGGLSRAQPVLSLSVPCLHISLPLHLVGRQLQLPLQAVAHSLLGL